MEKRGPLFGLLGDFFSEFFSLDGRHLRTALKLAIPGKLTELYLEGKRASHIPPVRVYFVSSLLFFLLVGIPTPDASNTNVYVNDVLIGREEPDPKLTQFQLLNFEESRTGRWVQKTFFKNVDQLYEMDPQDLLDAFFRGLERTIPTGLILFLPGLALALKLLYVRRRVLYVDHLVVAVHVQSFMFVMFVIVRLVNLVGLDHLYPGWVNYIAAFFLVMPLYLVLAMRRLYRQGWIKTFLKMVLLCGLYPFLAQPIMLLTFGLVIRQI